VNAKHVHEGALGFSNPLELYKEASVFFLSLSGDASRPFWLTGPIGNE
jgi:hypothetical protein